MQKQAIVFCAILVLASAFLERASLEPIPEKYKDQKGCFLSELDKVIPFNTATPSKARCVEYNCSKSIVTITGCSVVATSPPCVVVEDREKPYPHCCPSIKCP